VDLGVVGVSQLGEAAAFSQRSSASVRRVDASMAGSGDFVAKAALPRRRYASARALTPSEDAAARGFVRPH